MRAHDRLRRTLTSATYQPDPFGELKVLTQKRVLQDEMLRFMAMLEDYMYNLQP